MHSMIRLRNSFLAKSVIYGKHQNMGNSHLLSSCNSEHKVQSTAKHFTVNTGSTITHWNRAGSLKGTGALGSPLHPSPISVTPMLSLLLDTILPGAVMNNSGCLSGSSFCTASAQCQLLSWGKLWFCVHVVRSLIYIELCHSLVL